MQSRGQPLCRFSLIYGRETGDEIDLELTNFQPFPRNCARNGRGCVGRAGTKSPLLLAVISRHLHAKTQTPSLSILAILPASPEPTRPASGDLKTQSPPKRAITRQPRCRSQSLISSVYWALSNYQGSPAVGTMMTGLNCPATDSEAFYVFRYLRLHCLAQS
jgi:hypothetical protein